MLYVTRPSIEHARTCANFVGTFASDRAAAQPRRWAGTLVTCARVCRHHPDAQLLRRRAHGYPQVCFSLHSAHARGELTGTCSPSWLYTIGDARTCSSDVASALRIDCAPPARARAKGAVPLPASTLCKAAARHERCSRRSCGTSINRARSRRSRAWLSSADLVATARTFGVAGRPRGAAVLEE